MKLTDSPEFLDMFLYMYEEFLEGNRIAIFENYGISFVPVNEWDGSGIRLDNEFLLEYYRQCLQVYKAWLN